MAQETGSAGGHSRALRFGGLCRAPREGQPAIQKRVSQCSGVLGV